MTVDDIVNLLKETEHNGYPVVSFCYTLFHLTVDYTTFSSKTGSIERESILSRFCFEA